MKHKQTVLVTLVTRQKQQIKVNEKVYIPLSGLAELVPARTNVYNIVAWYSTGKCKTTSGDVWNVVKCSNGKADYIALG